MITITYNNQSYQVGYTRAAAQEAEHAGFDMNRLGSQPNVMIPLLVYYAFRAYQPKIRRQTVDEIYQQLTGKGDFVAALTESYADTANTLLEDAGEGNAQWTMD